MVNHSLARTLGLAVVMVLSRLPGLARCLGLDPWGYHDVLGTWHDRHVMDTLNFQDVFMPHFGIFVARVTESILGSCQDVSHQHGLREQNTANMKCHKETMNDISLPPHKALMLMTHTYQHECMTCHKSAGTFACDTRFCMLVLAQWIFSSLRLHFSTSHLSLQLWGQVTQAKYLRPRIVHILSTSIYLKYN